ncbi:hypothetical protein [Candidatus Paracaedibacter symbiosus]|uniref:hypothetical protein n=1 Tax=Candidatus Paracaedibacter symbiosus TaxID=244582 RepID=UPI000509CF8F|nr:hypothetical protein [Candidatus Paracaedibacter symbiosus]
MFDNFRYVLYCCVMGAYLLIPKNAKAQDMPNCIDAPVDDGILDNKPYCIIEVPSDFTFPPQPISVIVVSTREELPNHYARTEMFCEFNQQFSPEGNRLTITYNQIHSLLDEIDEEISNNLLSFSIPMEPNFPSHYKKPYGNSVVLLGLEATSRLHNRLFFNCFAPYRTPNMEMLVKLSLITTSAGTKLDIQRLTD